MLDEEEFAVIANLYAQSLNGAKEFRTQNRASLSDIPLAVLFQPVREAYLKMTGMDESNENAIMHHRISLYGPPCEYCGKPLRTPRASFCAACGKVPGISSVDA